jgi:hypothetical protein
VDLGEVSGRGEGVRGAGVSGRGPGAGGGAARARLLRRDAGEAGNRPVHPRRAVGARVAKPAGTPGGARSGVEARRSPLRRALVGIRDRDECGRGDALARDGTPPGGVARDRGCLPGRRAVRVPSVGDRGGGHRGSERRESLVGPGAGRVVVSRVPRRLPGSEAPCRGRPSDHPTLARDAVGADVVGRALVPGGASAARRRGAGEPGAGTQDQRVVQGRTRGGTTRTARRLPRRRVGGDHARRAPREADRVAPRRRLRRTRTRLPRARRTPRPGRHPHSGHPRPCAVGGRQVDPHGARRK